VKAICAIKESSGSFARMLEHVVHFPGLQRICGADDQAVDSFLWGENSWIAGASNFMPAEHVALYEACVLRKDFADGLRLMKAMLKMFYLLEQGGNIFSTSSTAWSWRVSQAGRRALPSRSERGRVPTVPQPLRRDQETRVWYVRQPDEQTFILRITCV